MIVFSHVVLETVLLYELLEKEKEIFIFIFVDSDYF